MALQGSQICPESTTVRYRRALRQSTVRQGGELRSSETQIGLPSGSSGKEPAWQETSRDAAPIFVSDRAPGGGHGDSLQDSCLEHSVDRGDWCAMVYSHIGLQMGHS